MIIHGKLPQMVQIVATAPLMFVQVAAKNSHGKRFAGLALMSALVLSIPCHASSETKECVDELVTIRDPATTCTDDKDKH